MTPVKRIRKQIAGVFLVGIAGLAITGLCLVFMQDVGLVMDALYGWLAGMGFHVAGLAVFGFAPGRPLGSFLALSLGFIFVRLFVLIILVVIVLMGTFLQAEPFVAGLLPAYFIGSWMEIAALASAQNRELSTKQGKIQDGDG